MVRYHCTLEEIRLIREGLLRVENDARKEILDEVEHSLEKLEKINYPQYDKLIKVIKTSKELYDRLGKVDVDNGAAVVIEHREIPSEAEIKEECK